MAKKHEERFGSMEQEVSEMKIDLQKLPVMEEKAVDDRENHRTPECVERKAATTSTSVDEKLGLVEFKSRHLAAATPGTYEVY